MAEAKLDEEKWDLIPSQSDEIDYKKCTDQQTSCFWSDDKAFQILCDENQVSNITSESKGKQLRGTIWLQL